MNTTRIVALVALLGLLLAPSVYGQSADRAPAGNAHPDAAAVSDAGGSNPFGDIRESSFDLDKKRAFSREVDLGPLRDLAVSHGGRVKILDTLARETVQTIAGRPDYLDFDKQTKASGKLDVKKVKYDPLFTFLDMIIDPAYYADRPLIHINFLPVREAFLQRAFEDPDDRERWKKVGRLRPFDVEVHREAVINELEISAENQRSVDKTITALTLYINSWQNLLMVAPDAAEKEWRHLSVFGDGTTIGDALAELGEAWRVGDAERVNAAAIVIAEQLPQVNAEIYPTTKRRLEATYNASKPFSWGYWIYGLSFVMLLLAFGTRWKTLVVVGIVALIAAILLHGTGFGLRSYIAERYAIQNQFESMTGLSLGAAIFGLIMMAVRKQWLFGAAAAGVGFLTLITASTTGIPGESIQREAAILNTSVLLKYHVTTVLMSYGLIALAFVISLFYLGSYYLRGKPAGDAEAGVSAVEVSAGALGLDDDAPKGPQRVLSDLDSAQMIIIQLAFWTLGVGILLGAWWADHSWGRWWAFDPKELWALITWICYLVVVHTRFAVTGSKRGLLTAWLSVVGFIIMLWTYFGVNLLLPGLHAYA